MLTGFEGRRLTARVSPAAYTRLLILTAAAAWGLGIAIAIAPIWRRPAPASQLAGFMKSQGLDALGPVLQIASLVILPIVTALMSKVAVAYLEQPDTRRWAVQSSAAALLLGLWGSFARPAPLWWTIVPPAMALAAFTLLRRISARFSRHDLILFPVWLTLFLGLIDVWPSLGHVRAAWCAAGTVLSLRLILVLLVSTNVSPANLFMFSPLGLLPLIRDVGPSQRTGGTIAVAIALLSPFLVALFKPSQKKARLVVAFVTYPITVMSYQHVVNIKAAEVFHRVSLFEDGHGLMPASEMMRGEVLYQDVTPGHGAVADGLLDYFALRFGGETLGAALNVRAALGSLTPLAIYAVGFAAMGSPELGMLGFFFTAAYIRNPILFLRPAPALFALAFMIAGLRKHRVRYLAMAGAFLVAALLTSVDFALMSALTLLVAILSFSESHAGRLRAIKAAVLGISIGFLPLLLLLLLYGVLPAFFRVTFLEVLTLGPAYSIGDVTFPESFKDLKSFPEALSLLFDPHGGSYVLWCVVAVITAAMFVARPFFIPRRTAGIFLAGCWVLAASLSYAERHHRYFYFVLPTYLVASAFLLWRWRTWWSRPLAIVATASLLIVAQPTPVLIVATIIRTSTRPFDSNLAEYPRLPRARGALLNTSDFPKLDAAHRFISTLAPNETYFDFSNLPLLYFLVNKPCPIRQFEVPFFQHERLQREVVLRLDNDRSVQAALISFPTGTTNLDGIPNPERAPLVWRYLESQFEPSFDEEGVVFWRRKS